MHLDRVILHAERFPGRSYPFNLEPLRQTPEIVFQGPITFFVGENGTGKSTLLRAITQVCGVHIWSNPNCRRVNLNPHEDALHRYLEVRWVDGPVPGSLFSSEHFRYFSEQVEDWAGTDEALLEYFGGKSLLTQSHGQSLMSFFGARYRIKGLYFLDEPETALSPRRQLELLGLLKEMGQAGHAQFIIATHSPILMSCPGASILSFDEAPLGRVEYRETEHYRVFRDFCSTRWIETCPRCCSALC